MEMGLRWETYSFNRRRVFGKSLPKIEACIRFIEYGGEEAMITCLDCADDALEGRGGTHIIP